MNDDFRYMVAIADAGSISKAARAINMSQPGLSQRLRRLEAYMGVELFDRSTLPLKPTAPGAVFLDYARKALAAEDSMRREVSGLLAQRQRRLRVGVSMSRANAVLGAPIVEFYESHKGCTLELRQMGSLEQLHDLFIGDEIDFAVLTPIAPDPAMYDMEVLCRERLVVAVSAELELPQLVHASQHGVELRQLEGIPFVLPTCGEYYDPMISRIVDVARLQLDIVVRDCSIDLALAMVGDGLGMTVVPSTSLSGYSNLRIYELRGIQAGNVLRYIRRCDRDVSPEERLFMSLVRNHLNACLC